MDNAMDKSATQSGPPTGGVTPTPRLLRAVATAARAHEGHYRKSTPIPYISHPFSVMLLTSRVTDDEDVLVAALFHDILEDVPEAYSAEQMSAEFGPRVVDIVRGVTKDESIRDWQGRSDAYLAALAKAPEGSVIVAAADKFHNLSSTLEDLRRDGPAVWGRFNSSPGQQLWWYTSVLEVIAGRLPGLPLLPELGEMVDQLRAYVEE